ncbi:MAG: hypothetical protein D6744_02135 [Planctomycetota bacterium]|nr:MAG: hypothetical protein D6744_02135 [Planctomycetota bacterium]
MPEPLLTRYLQPLLAGRRAECFSLIQSAIESGGDPETLMRDVVWPATVQVRRLFDDDRINAAIENMACRINRTIADQLQARLPQTPPSGKRIIVVSADPQHEELGAQMLADLFQSRGWEVYFLGGALPDDEIVELVGRVAPNALLIFGSEAPAVPLIRALIHRIRDIGICPTMNIVVSGGVFGRADGLWREVGADLHIEEPFDAVERIDQLEPRTCTAVRTGFVKQRRRRRKAAVASAAT